MSTAYEPSAREETQAAREKILAYAAEQYPTLLPSARLALVFGQTRFPMGSVEEWKRELQAYKEAHPNP